MGGYSGIYIQAIPRKIIRAGKKTGIRGKQRRKKGKKKETVVQKREKNFKKFNIGPYGRQ